MVAQEDNASIGNSTTDASTREVDNGAGETGRDGNTVQLQAQAQMQSTSLPQPNPQSAPTSYSESQLQSSSKAAPQSSNASSTSRSHRPAPILTSPPVTFPASASSIQHGNARTQAQSSVPNSALSSSSTSTGPKVSATSTSSIHSPSPSRRAAFAARELGPLLANLSPMATLEALKASDAVDKHASSQNRFLAESIAHVSAAERALGIRAAVAGKKLREWFAEVDGWETEWEAGKGFVQPEIKDLVTEETNEGSEDEIAVGKGKAKAWIIQEHIRDVEYWGSLPAATVVERERRLDEIQDEMEALELEELKTYVRKAHSRSRRTKGEPPDSPESTALRQQPSHRPSSSYAKLDDFTVVITATIMHALPHLSRLSSLIELWQTRLLVLRRVPRFLHLLDAAKRALREAQHAIDDDKEHQFTRQDFYATRDILRAKNNAMAETLDSMLDILEGRPDSIPDEWIEEMEALEEKRGDWVADAEDAVMNNILGAANVESPRERDANRALDSIEERYDGLEAIEESAEESEYYQDANTDGESRSVSRQQYGLDSQAIPRIDEPASQSRPLTMIQDVDYARQDAGSARSSMTVRPRHDSSHLRHTSATYSMLTNSPDLATADTVEYFNATPQAQEVTTPGSRPALLEIEDKTRREKSKSRSRSRGRLAAQSAHRLAPGSAGKSSRSRSNGSEVRDQPTTVRRIEVKRLEYSDADETEATEDERPVSVRRISALAAEKAANDEINFHAANGGFQVSPGKDESDYDASSRGDDAAPAVETMDFANVGIESHISSLHDSTAHAPYSEAGDADVEDIDGLTDAGESTIRSHTYQPSLSSISLSASTSAPWPPTAHLQAHKPRKSSSDETGHTRSSSGMLALNGRSRASTLNTYEAWSDHEDSEEEGDIEGGYRSYRRMSQLTALEEGKEKRASRVMQAQVDPSFSYDDVFDSLVQPLSQPGSPNIGFGTGVNEADLIRPMTKDSLLGNTSSMGFPGFDGVGVAGNEVEDGDSSPASEFGEPQIGPQRIDYTKRPSIPGLPNLRSGEHTRTKSATLSLKDMGKARADHIKRPSVSGLRNLNLNAEATGNLQHDEVRSIKEPKTKPSNAPRQQQAEKPERARRHQSESQVPHTTISNKSSSVPVAKPNKPLRHHSEDQITERISTLLSRIEAPIRLYSGPEPDAYEVASSPPATASKSPPLAINTAIANAQFETTSHLPEFDETPGSPVTDPRTPLNSNPPEYFPAHVSPPTSTPILKLAPASAPTSSSKSRSSQSEVKLYYLHQPGRAQPIKLFVRLVGEGAGRVMVRVGGGWSDLEEYLKEYALHHGRSAAISTQGENGNGMANIEVMDVDAHSNSHPRKNSPNLGLGMHSNRSVSKFKEMLDENDRAHVSRPGTPSARSVRSAKNNGAEHAASRSRSRTPGPHAPPSTSKSTSNSPSIPSLPVASKDYVSRARRHVSAGTYLNKPSFALSSGSSSSPASSTAPFERPSLDTRFENSPSPNMGYSVWISAQGDGAHGHGNGHQRRDSNSPSVNAGGNTARRPSAGSLSLGHARKWSVFRPSTPRAQMMEEEEDGEGQRRVAGLGLAGPNGRREDISPRKKAWVEGVMRQARKVSGGGSGGGESASGTKRVFLRRASLRGERK